MKSVRRLVLSLVFVFAVVGAMGAGLLFGNLKPLLGLDLVGGLRVVLTAPAGTPLDVLERTLETVRNRVDAFGVAEPDIAIIGDRNIEVQIPNAQEQVGGADATNRLLLLIGSTARLEEREVLQTIPEGDPAYESTPVTCPIGDDTAEAVEQGDKACTTEGLEEKEVVFPGEPGQTKYRLGPVRLTGDQIRRATAVLQTAGQNNVQAGWEVSFQLTSEGRETFAKVTQELVGKQLAIVLDRRVESAPNVNEAITGGSGVITGDFTETEAKDLALTLQTGALPIELTKSDVETVSPTLGKESLRQGLVAGIAGLIALALYLAFYYRLLGIVTWFGMVIWSVMAVGIVALLGRSAGYSLTLAGVAGLVVSIGITADSYIVYYERLKDEVRHGKTPRVAVVPAFKRAWKTIIAADIVTILAALVLYLLAIGSVRGFALTLGLATALDLFVVYFYKRPAVNLIARSRKLSNLRGIGLRSGVAADPMPSAAPELAGSRR
ncbi:MAG: protein translocase subunit SecD [Actinobacteria bacterium]|nr:protein translocase subunit SecD [Actinomycetota bacterium]